MVAISVQVVRFVTELNVYVNMEKTIMEIVVLKFKNFAMVPVYEECVALNRIAKVVEFVKVSMIPFLIPVPINVFVKMVKMQMDNVAHPVKFCVKASV